MSDTPEQQRIETASEFLQRVGTDGALWASEFKRIALKLGYPVARVDEGWLIGWFANAIEQGRAAALTPQAPAGLDAIEKAVDALCRAAVEASRHGGLGSEGNLLKADANKASARVNLLTLIRAELDAVRGGTVDVAAAYEDAIAAVRLNAGLSPAAECAATTAILQRAQSASPQPQPAPDRGEPDWQLQALRAGWSAPNPENEKAMALIRHAAELIDKPALDRSVVVPDTDHLIDLLTDGEGDSVTFCSKNVDFNGLPNECVTVNADWTDWKDVDFRADTREQCLRDALAALVAASVAPPVRPASDEERG